jgi:hypothetical protein
MRKHFYLLLSTCFLLLYAVTAQHGVSWQDSGEFQYRVLSHDYFWISGIARAHPAYIAGAELFLSFFPLSCRLTALALFSGLGMSIALLFLARILSHLKLKPSTIFITVATLGLSHMAWWMSTVAEVYTWSLAFLLAEILCVVHLCEEGTAKQKTEVRSQKSEASGQKIKTGEQTTSNTIWIWILLALLNGLHASIHNFAFLNLPVYALLFFYLNWRKNVLRSFALLVLTAFAWLAGASLLMALCQLEWQENHSLIATLKSLLFGREFEAFVKGMHAINWPLAKMNLALACISLLNPAWCFACFAGRTRNKQTLFKITLLGLTAIHGLFWVRYFVPDQATFILPTLTLLAVWVGIGLDSVTLQRRHLIALASLIILSSIITPLLIHQVLQAKQGGVKRARALPFREESSYWLYPWKHNEHSAALFVQEARKLLKEGDLLIADNTAAGPLMAAQAAGLLTPNIRIITFFTGETEAELLSLVEQKERVYIVSPVAGYASPALLTGWFQFEKEGVLYRIRKVRHD